MNNAMTLERKMVKWSKAQIKNHPASAGQVAQDLKGRVLLPCTCGACRQPELSDAELELVQEQEQRNMDHAETWAGLE